MPLVPGPLLLLLGVLSMPALADPTDWNCDDGGAPDNPHKTIGNCDLAHVPWGFGTPFAGGLTINFQAVGAVCVSDLLATLTTNGTSAQTDDWTFYGSCTVAGPATDELCRIFVDDDLASGPDVMAIVVRGTNNADTIVAFEAGADMWIDAGMDSSLQAYFYGEGGVDSLAGAGSVNGSTVPMTIRGGPDGDKIDVSSMDIPSQLFGDGGNDWIEGGIDVDTIQGGADNDWIIGNFGSDFLYGNGGDDEICGENNICGLAPANCWSGFGNPIVLVCNNPAEVANNDQDHIEMGAPGTGNSFANGGPGDDVIATQGSPGTYDGGEHQDRIGVTTLGTGVTVNGGPGDDKICDWTADAELNGDDGDDEIWATNSPVFGNINGGDDVDDCAGSNYDNAQPGSCPL